MEHKWTIGNIVYAVNALVLVLAFMMMGIKAASAQDQRAADLLQERTYSAQDSDRLAKAEPVDQQLARYTRRIPEMGFLRIYGDKGARFTNRLAGLLGNGAVNLDYAHEEEQRRDVVNLQLHRIARMAQENLPSATLFRLGKDSAFKHRYLCVITLDTTPYQLNADYATNLMTSDMDLELSDSPIRPYIRNEDFLRFTVDHEVFHCLNAYFNGASFRQTSNGVTSHYDHFLNEAKADAYASLMFNQTPERKKEFLHNMAAIRTQALAVTDTLHATSKIIRLSSGICLAVGMLEPEEVVYFATKLVNQNSPNLSEYGQHLANMVEAVKRLGGDVRQLIKTFELDSLPRPDEIKVAAMVEQVVNGRDRIQGNEPMLTVLNAEGQTKENQNDS
ncbi:MAG: hypothetical protein ACWGOV_09080 [Acidiferrobacterales bacterium]